MKHFPYCRALAVAACLLLTLPAWAADDATDPLPSPLTEDAADTDAVDVQALIDGGAGASSAPQAGRASRRQIATARTRKHLTCFVEGPDSGKGETEGSIRVTRE